MFLSLCQLLFDILHPMIFWFLGQFYKCIWVSMFFKLLIKFNKKKKGFRSLISLKSVYCGWSKVKLWPMRILPWYHVEGKINVLLLLHFLFSYMCWFCTALCRISSAPMRLFILNSATNRFSTADALKNAISHLTLTVPW